MFGWACIWSDDSSWPPQPRAFFCFFLAMIACPTGLAAQEAGPSTQIVVPRTLTVEAPGEINVDIRLVAPRGVVPNYSIVIRGLPPSVKLSAGEPIGSDTWKVPVLELSDLKMTLLADAVGTSEVEFTLVTTRNVILAKASSELIVERPAVMETLPARGAEEQAEKSSENALNRHTAEEARQGEDASAEESRKAELAEGIAAAEEVRKAAEARALEEAKAAEAEQARNAEAVRKLAEAEEVRRAQEAERVSAAERAEQARQAEDARAVKSRKVEQAERIVAAEEARKVAETRALEEARKTADRRRTPREHAELRRNQAAAASSRPTPRTEGRVGVVVAPKAGKHSQQVKPVAERGDVDIGKPRRANPRHRCAEIRSNPDMYETALVELCRTL